VNIIQAHNPFPADVDLDIEQLVQEQTQRTHSLKRALDFKPQEIDWDRAAQANTKFRRRAV
jgi:hypothetical protein